MTASDYPVTFPYGAKDGVFYGPSGSVGPYHRGDDRAMPIGTPVKVNGVQIGLSGNTGASSGPHLHIGKFISGADVNPEGKGFSLGGAKVVETGASTYEGNYVKLRDGSGAVWIYVHLSKITCTAGQALGVIMPSEADVNYMFKTFLKKTPTATQIASYTNKPWQELANNVSGTLRNSLVAESAKVTAAAATIESLKAEAVILAPGKYQVK